jgi:hypothetical protein
LGVPFPDCNTRFYAKTSSPAATTATKAGYRPIRHHRLSIKRFPGAMMVVPVTSSR